MLRALLRLVLLAEALWLLSAGDIPKVMVAILVRQPVCP